ncbi:hypothetical protein Ait01nite_095380 [Actinoplanes italicus]|nr:hypothetical protein [Actinoplanes italicus]GIE36493.1 hypothetical protein Ait01nite_095380 [Actinoplanes italicus]
MTMQISDAGGLQGTTVWSSDGEDLGDVGDVHVLDRAVQPLLVTFPSASDTPAVAPLFGAELREDGLVLAYPAERVRSGPTVGAGVVLSTGEVIAVLAFYGRQVSAAGPLTERLDGVGDVGYGEVQAVPSLPDIGDDDLPPIVVTRPSHSG